MIFWIKLALYFFGIITLGSIVFFIIKVQNILSVFVQECIKIQPYSSNILYKYTLLILSILESPLIFSSLNIFIVSLNFFFIKVENIFILLSIISYFLSISIVAITTVVVAEKPLINFMRSFALHPKFEKFLSSKVIVSMSLFQTPLLFLMVLSWLNILNVKEAIFNESFLCQKFLFSSSLCFMFSIAAVGVLKGMSFVIESYSKLGEFYPTILSKITNSNFYTTLGLVEAPIIFPFLINVAVINFIRMEKVYSFLNYIFPILFFIFGIIVAIVAYLSGKISSKSIYSLSSGNKIEKEIFSLNFISQVLLDARIIYYLIIIFLLIFKLNLL